MGKIYKLEFWEIWKEKIDSFFRKQKLKIYKKNKIKESKTRYYRMYHIKFNIKIEDPYNPQLSDVVYEMVVPGQAAYFAKKNLEESIREKIIVQVNEIEELNDYEYEKFKQSEYEYSKNLE